MEKLTKGQNTRSEIQPSQKQSTEPTAEDVTSIGLKEEAQEVVSVENYVEKEVVETKKDQNEWVVRETQVSPSKIFEWGKIIVALNLASFIGFSLLSFFFGKKTDYNTNALDTAIVMFSNIILLIIGLYFGGKSRS